MKAKNLRIGFGTGAVLLASASYAAASPVDNPGNFTLTPSDGAPLIDFAGPGGKVLSAGWSPNSGFISIDVDSPGTIDSSTAISSFPASDIGPIPGLTSTVTAQFVVSGNGISGSINAALKTVNIVLTGRVRFTGSLGTCLTAPFSVSMHEVPDVPGAGTFHSFTAYGDVAIPPVAVTGSCPAGSAAPLNTALGLNGTDKSRVFLYKTFFDTDVKGS
ncbi:hypothetical protein [Labilithrix luteola]|nr:hypothetical protein [Labilithrix luteola]